MQLVLDFGPMGEELLCLLCGAMSGNGMQPVGLWSCEKLYRRISFEWL